ncbi:MAG TPA: AbrB/MazE/SpoVT family DNA-binding domain-containing protein [Candidatus Binataceae bacterium]|nr:AbrB/MazE/SpoVT family DNA-binding domain-containing protein [Candidatus Binataceae bacterium]
MDVVDVTCARCGKYPLAPGDGLFPLPLSTVPKFLIGKGVPETDLERATQLVGIYLSMYTRECTEAHRAPELINLTVLTTLERLAQTCAFTPMPQKSDKLLRLIKKLTRSPGSPAQLNLELDYPAIHAVDPAEALYYLKDLAQKGLVESEAIERLRHDREDDVAVTLTPAGWGRLESALRPLATSHLTSKGQATIPVSVRTKLDLKPGEAVIFEESDTGTVYIRKAEPVDREFMSALEGTLSEWNSENDEKAYGDL